MREPVTGWTRYGQIARMVLLWRLGAGRPRAARVELAVALGVGVGEMRAILRCAQMPTEAQRATLARVVGVPADAWDNQKGTP